MKKYMVRICYTAYRDIEIEAENDADAWQIANYQEDRVINKFGKYGLCREIDSIEEMKDEPVEGDYIIRSCGRLLADTMVSIVGSSDFVTFSGEDQEAEMRAYIRDRMERENFYPTIWAESDHGNLEEIIFCEE